MYSADMWICNGNYVGSYISDVHVEVEDSSGQVEVEDGLEKEERGGCRAHFFLEIWVLY